MKTKITVLTLSAMLLALCSSAQAQQPARIPRIGILIASPASTFSARVEAFRQRLLELGYVEGKNIVIEWRFWEGEADRLAALAAKLVRLKVDVIVTGGATNTRAAKEATSTIPIVMTQAGDPVGSGFVASLARPGGNTTGLSSLAPAAVFGTSTGPVTAQSLREIDLAARAFAVTLQHLDVLDCR